MNLKKLLLILAIAFVIYYVLRSPDAAALAFKGAGKTTYDGLRQLAGSLARFVDKLFA
ncbi:MAG: hypothetical protein ABR507_09200 [Actinomycetota bacterium]|nr:hypothetical protein [Actinomycetota bacterium]